MTFVVIYSKRLVQPLNCPPFLGHEKWGAVQWLGRGLLDLAVHHPLVVMPNNSSPWGYIPNEGEDLTLIPTRSPDWPR